MFEVANLPGLEQMEASEERFQQVGLLGINDIAMAMQYQHTVRLPLPGVPIVAFDGLKDMTLDPTDMAHWGRYTTGPFKQIAVMGSHNLVSTHYHEARLSPQAFSTSVDM